jgi:hypothetical protein
MSINQKSKKEKILQKLIKFDELDKLFELLVKRKHTCLVKHQKVNVVERLAIKKGFTFAEWQQYKLYKLELKDKKWQ